MKSELKTYVMAEIQERFINYVIWKREGKKAHIIDVRAQEKKLPEEFDELIVTFSPELLKAQIRTQMFQRSKPDYIISSTEEKTITEAMEKEAESLMKTSMIENSGILAEDFQVIEMSLTSRKIDGYMVPQLKGFHGKEIEGVLTGLFLLKSMYSMYIHKAKRVKVRHVSHGIESFAAKKNKPGMYVLMGNRVTQIIGVREGKTLYFGEIRFGREDFVRIIEHLLGMQETTAHELQEQYAKGEISSSLKQKLHTMLAVQTQQCRSVFSKELENIEIMLPPDIFLLGEGSNLPEMKECLEGATLLTPNDIDTFEAPRGLDDARFTSLFLLMFSVLCQNEKKS
ncbi:hypothetical protein IIA94_00155 [Patescibacteria group bacterium]|nr:hypothetical protein [Patescibacteria group bacterium]